MVVCDYLGDGAEIGDDRVYYKTGGYLAGCAAFSGWLLGPAYREDLIRIKLPDSSVPEHTG